MKDRWIYLSALFIIFIFWGCRNKGGKTKQTEVKPREQIVYLTTGPDSNAILVADSVIYTVYLSNPDSLDEWRAFTLRYMNRDKLVDLIFQGIYDGHLNAYSYRDWVFGNKVVIPVDSVRKLETYKGRIGQIEFVERWFYSPQTSTFYKQVLEATLAYELYDNEGKVRGYAPLFKVFFCENKEKQIAK